jgi:hypothetical protein
MVALTSVTNQDKRDQRAPVALAQVAVPGAASTVPRPGKLVCGIQYSYCIMI